MGVGTDVGSKLGVGVAQEHSKVAVQEGSQYCNMGLVQVPVLKRKPGPVRRQVLVHKLVLVRKQVQAHKPGPVHRQVLVHKQDERHKPDVVDIQVGIPDVVGILGEHGSKGVAQERHIRKQVLVWHSHNQCMLRPSMAMQK